MNAVVGSRVNASSRDTVIVTVASGGPSDNSSFFDTVTT